MNWAIACWEIRSPKSEKLNKLNDKLLLKNRRKVFYFLSVDVVVSDY
jgi:hypothetical protein